MMKPSIQFISVLLFLHLNVFAQEDPVNQEEKIYKKVGSYELKADVFYTHSGLNKQNSPAIAFFHGGGWVYGNPDEFHSTCERFARKGFVAFSFQYRLSIMDDGSHPHPDISPIESVKDARSAIRWIRGNAESLKIDPEKIVAGGQSAGGQLTLSTALMDEINEETDNLNISPVPNAMLLYSSSVNMMEAWADYHMGDRRDQIWNISPYHNLKKDMPPTIAFHGEEDCTVPLYAVRFFEEKMKELGNDYELITYKGRKHYLGAGIDKYSTYFDEQILERTDEFLIQFGFMKKEDK
jgi:acetyl esterase/lipase